MAAILFSLQGTPWESEWRVIGDKGSVTWDGAEGFRAKVVANDVRQRYELTDKHPPQLLTSAVYTFRWKHWITRDSPSLAQIAGG